MSKREERRWKDGRERDKGKETRKTQGGEKREGEARSRMEER